MLHISIWNSIQDWKFYENHFCESPVISVQFHAIHFLCSGPTPESNYITVLRVRQVCYMPYRNRYCADGRRGGYIPYDALEIIHDGKFLKGPILEGHG